jgi:hypothetical protein
VDAVHRAGRARRRAARIFDRDPDDPFTPAITRAEEVLLGYYGIRADQRWDWRAVALPYADQSIATVSDHRAWLLSYLREDLRQAAQGNVHGPLKAALDVLRDLRNEIRLIVDHGGLSGDSYRDDLEGWYTPLNAFLSIGPPPQRIEEMIALIEAGVLDVVGPGMTVDLDRGLFRTRSALVPDVEFHAEALIDARLPEVDLRDTFGVPTETVHWVTAAGIRPGVNSVILGDADAVARAGYSAAALTPAKDSYATAS